MRKLLTITTTLLFAVTAFAKPPKIGKKEAVKAALERVKGGKIVSSELEEEAGKRIWSFDIRTGDHLTEVWVDAATGKVIKEQIETPADEKAEAVKDKAEKAKERAMIEEKGVVAPK